MTEPRMPDGWTFRMMRRWQERELAEEQPDAEFRRAWETALVVGLAPGVFALTFLAAWLSSNPAMAHPAQLARTLDWGVAGIVSAPVLPGAFVVWVALALRKERPWARKAASGLCVAALLGTIALAGWCWIGIARLFWSAGGGILLGGGGWSQLYSQRMLVVLLLMVGWLAATALASWKLVRAFKFLTSDDAKRICGEIDDNGEGTQNRPREGAEG